MRRQLAVRWFGPAATAAMFALIVALLGLAGQSDLEAEQAEEAHYCSMVADGYWPAYDDAIDCQAVSR